MKHKLLQFISVLVIATFALQDLALLRQCYNQKLATKNYELRTALRPRAIGEREQGWRGAGERGAEKTEPSPTSGLDEDTVSYVVNRITGILARRNPDLALEQVRIFAWDGMTKAWEQFNPSRGISLIKHLEIQGVRRAKDQMRREGYMKYCADESSFYKRPLPLLVDIEDSQQTAGLTTDKLELDTAKISIEIDKIRKLCSPAAWFILGERYINGKSDRDIAAEIGISKITIWQQRTRAERLIKKGLDADIDLRMSRPKMCDDFGERIKQARLALGMRREELAKQIGVSYSTIQDWENMHCAPTYNSCHTLAMTLKMPLLSIIKGIEGAIAPESTQRELMVAQGQGAEGESTTGANLKSASLRDSASEAIEYSILRPSAAGEKLAVRDKFIPGQFNVIKDFAEKPFTQIFTLMERNHCSAAVRMPKVDVAAFLADTLKSERSKDTNDFGWFKRKEFRHQPISTSCSPTNFKGEILRCSTSKQRCMASLIRFINVGSVFAWVWQPFKVGTVATKTSSSSFSIKTKNCFFSICNLPPVRNNIVYLLRSQVELAVLRPRAAGEKEPPSIYYEAALQAREFIAGNREIFLSYQLNIVTCMGHSFEVRRRLESQGIESEIFIYIDEGKKIYHVWIETNDGYIIDAYPLVGGEPRILRRSEAKEEEYKGERLLEIKKWAPGVFPNGIVYRDINACI